MCTDSWNIVPKGFRTLETFSAECTKITTFFRCITIFILHGKVWKDSRDTGVRVGLEKIAAEWKIVLRTTWKTWKYCIYWQMLRLRASQVADRTGTWLDCDGSWFESSTRRSNRNYWEKERWCVEQILGCALLPGNFLLLSRIYFVKQKLFMIWIYMFWILSVEVRSCHYDRTLSNPRKR